ncbi:MAG TPA: hypothetical protein PKZ86_12170, partial [Smithella sp.]|nr:hypothetical protein [Smithella sp.]HQH17885.1 hypothetical protein [Smithella sp.]
MKKQYRTEWGRAVILMMILLVILVTGGQSQAARISGLDESNAPAIVEDDGGMPIEEPSIVEEPLEDAVSAREKTLLPEKSAKETVPPKKGADKEEKKS